MTNKSRLFVAPLLPFLSSISLAACTGASSGEPSTESNSSAGTSDSSGTSSPSSTSGSSTGNSGGPTGTGVSSTGTTSQTTGNTGGSTGSTSSSNTGGSTGNTSSAGTSDTSDTTTGNTSDAMTGTSGTTSATDSSQTVSGDSSSDQTSAPDPDVLTVQLQDVKQIMRGFGINATIMPGGETLPWEQLFTLEGENALGLSILRIGMNESGGHRDVPSGWETVKTLGARVIGSCWSAPANWKDPPSTTAGGHLLADYYEEWATRIADYANEHGLYAMSLGNETDFASCDDSAGTCVPPLTDEYESMVYTGKELSEFVKIARPIFQERAPDTLMIAPEASLWIHVWSNLSPNGEGIPGAGYKSSDPLDCNCFANVLDDTAAIATCASHCQNGAGGELAEGGYDYGHWLAKDDAAWNSFDILGVHEYETQVGYAWPADVTGGVRTKEVWQTEMSGVMYWPEQGPSTDIDNGIAVARWIHSALTVGEASAWLYWWYEAYYQNDNEGLALIQGSNTIAKRYYTMGNFSRYIRPDVFHAVRVAGPSPANVMVSAYKGDNDEVVIVAINETNAAVDLPIAVSGGTVPAAMVPYVTSATANWEEGAAVALAEGSLPASLPAMSVTTFVSE